MGIGVAITSFDLYHGVQSMFSGCPGCKDRVFIFTSLAKYEFRMRNLEVAHQCL
jgi:hypothetical protein